jgi:hypothetical protein
MRVNSRTLNCWRQYGQGRRADGASQPPVPSDLGRLDNGAAKMRAALSAADGKRCGWRTVGLTGRRTMTTVGVVGFDQLDCDRLAVGDWPEASSVTLDVAGLHPVKVPGRG